MSKQLFYSILFLFTVSFVVAQVEKEVLPPYNIRTVTFVQSGQNIVPLVQLGDSFQLQFDDLFGNEANYYYVITHCDYDWRPSQLVKS